MSSFKTQNKKLQPGTVLVGENGLPVDTIATIAGSNLIVGNVPQPLVYAAGVVTVPSSVDLTPVRYHKSRYTGRLILRTNDNVVYFIDRVSVDDSLKQFSIYLSIDQTAAPSTIDVTAGWSIAEAEIVNRLATTAAAKIDQVEFKDMHFQIELDGDPVTVRGKNGNTLEPNPDGSVNIGGTVNVNADFTEVNQKLDNIDAELEQANATLDDIADGVDQANGTLDEIQANTQGTVLELEQANTTLSNIEQALSQPLQISQPVIAAGTVDGLASSAPVIFVNNIKNQILAAHDRQQEIIYADFGTKNQRVVEIIYTSATFPLFTATKTFTYTLVGNRYRRDTITWSVT